MSFHGVSGKLVGFGADELSPEDKVLAYATATGCPGMLPNGCFDLHMATTKAECAAHMPPPPGATQFWWNAFCNKLSTCGYPKLCPNDEATVLASLPQCLDAAGVAILDYVNTHVPASDGTVSGPDRDKNAASTIAHMSPAMLARMNALPHCGTVQSAGPLPAQAPPATQPPPSADYSAPITPDAVTAPAPAPIPYAPAAASATGSSTGRYVLFGILGVAALGGAYLAFRK